MPKATTAKSIANVLNYSLRPAKNIERKMMGEAFARLSPIAPLGRYRYVGFGSEFFNDFSLYHQTLGINEMISIEFDEMRVERCKFNQPHTCVTVMPGTASEILPQLDWTKRTIVWLDYLGHLDHSKLQDIRLVASQVVSGSMGIWTVKAQTWSGPFDEETLEKVSPSEWPPIRLKKFRELFAPHRTFADLEASELVDWGLAKKFHEIVTDEIRIALNDRNAGADENDRIKFLQCFHFRYADGVKMLTVGGLFVNRADEAKMGTEPFGALDFICNGKASFEIAPPILTGHEVRHLSRLLPCADDALPTMKWLTSAQLKSFKRLYRYYPLFAESEL